MSRPVHPDRRGLRRAEQLDVEDLGRRLGVWGRDEWSRHRDIDCRRAPSLPERHVHHGGIPHCMAGRESWQRGNHAVRSAVYPVAQRPRCARADSIISAAPTHWDPRCGWSCAILNLAIASALRQDNMRPERVTADSLLDAALAGVRASLSELEHYGYDARVPDEVREAVEDASRGNYETCASTAATWVIRCSLSGRGWSRSGAPPASTGIAVGCRGRWRHRYERRRRRCGAPGAILLLPHTRAVERESSGGQAAQRTDGVVCRSLGGREGRWAL